MQSECYHHVGKNDRSQEEVDQFCGHDGHAGSKVNGQSRRLCVLLLLVIVSLK
jgi:hypothetical protein